MHRKTKGELPWIFEWAGLQLLSNGRKGIPISSLLNNDSCSLLNAPNCMRQTGHTTLSKLSQAVRRSFTIEWGSGTVTMIVLWNPAAPPISGREKNAGKFFEDSGSQDSCKIGFLGTWSATNCWYQPNAGHALQLHTYAILKDAVVENVVSLAYCTWFRRTNKLSAAVDGEALSNFTDESK